jgi:hypothetical protein
MPATDADRSRVGRMGALARNAAAQTGTEITEKARRTFRDSFLAGHDCRTCGKAVVIDPGLPLAERERRAELLYRLHMTRISQLAAKRRAWARVGTALGAAFQAELENESTG